MPDAYLDNVLSRLQRVSLNAETGQYAARCPAHDDQHPSLSVRIGDSGKVILQCHRDPACSYQAILDALGLSASDLNPNGTGVRNPPHTAHQRDTSGHRQRTPEPDLPSSAQMAELEAIKAAHEAGVPYEEVDREPKHLTFLRRNQMTQPDPTERWLVKDFLKPESLAVIAGSSGIGKSWIRTELGLLLAAGHGKFLGFYDVVTDPITVLCVDEENGEGPEWERDGVQMQRLGLEGQDLPYYRVSQPGLRLDQEGWQEALTEQVAAHQPGLLLLDSISAMHRFRELRDDQHPVHDYLRGLMAAHPPLSIVLVHHLRGRDKATKRFVERDLDDLRGGGWDQWPDAVGLLSQMANRRALWVAYKRIPYQRLTLIQSQEGPLTFASDLNADEPETVMSRDDRVLDAIRAGATSDKQVEQATGLKRSTIYDALASLREHRLVEKGTPLRETPEQPTLSLKEDDQ
jgi:AAA domain